MIVGCSKEDRVASSIYDKAKKLESLERREEAYVLYKVICIKYPDEIICRDALRNISTYIQDKDSEFIFDLATTMEPLYEKGKYTSDKRYMTFIANTYSKASCYPKAMAWYRKVLTKFPDFTDASFALALTYADQEEYGESTTLLLKIIEKNRKDELYYKSLLNLGDYNTILRNYAVAEKYLNEVMNDCKYDEMRAIAMLYKSNIKNKQGDFSKESELQKKIIDMYPDTVASNVVKSKIDKKKNPRIKYT